MFELDDALQDLLVRKRKHVLFVAVFKEALQMGD